MPAKSEAQRRLFAAALAAKRGDKNVGGQAKEIAKTVSEEDIRDFAKKPVENKKDKKDKKEESKKTASYRFNELRKKHNLKKLANACRVKLAGFYKKADYDPHEELNKPTEPGWRGLEAMYYNTTPANIVAAAIADDKERNGPLMPDQQKRYVPNAVARPIPPNAAQESNALLDWLKNNKQYLGAGGGAIAGYGLGRLLGLGGFGSTLLGGLGGVGSYLALDPKARESIANWWNQQTTKTSATKKKATSTLDVIKDAAKEVAEENKKGLTSVGIGAGTYGLARLLGIGKPGSLGLGVATGLGTYTGSILGQLYNRLASKKASECCDNSNKKVKMVETGDKGISVKQKTANALNLKQYATHKLAKVLSKRK